MHQKLDCAAPLPETVQQYVSAFNQRELDRLAALFHPQAVLIAPIQQQVRSRAAIRRYIAEKGEGMTIEPQHWEQCADVITLHGRVRAPGFDLPARWHFRIVAGTILRMHLQLVAPLKALLAAQANGPAAVRQA